MTRQGGDLLFKILGRRSIGRYFEPQKVSDWRYLCFKTWPLKKRFLWLRSLQKHPELHSWACYTYLDTLYKLSRSARHFESFYAVLTNYNYRRQSLLRLATNAETDVCSISKAYKAQFSRKIHELYFCPITSFQFQNFRKSLPLKFDEEIFLSHSQIRIY